MIARQALKFTACALAAVLLLTAPAVAQGSISREYELAVGRVTAVRIVERYPIVADTEWLVFLGSLRDALASFSGRTDVEHQIVIIQEDTPNAASTPGYLFFTTGLIRLNLDREGWAFIVAHEIAHTARRHIAIQIEKARAAALINVLVAVLTGSRDAGDLAEILAHISQLGHTRTLEVEADGEAMRMMTEAGFNPEKAAGTLRFFNDATGRRNEQTHWAGTHPGFAERVSRVEETRRQLTDQGLPLRVSYYAREARTGSLVIRLVRVVETRRQWSALVEIENGGASGANINSMGARLQLADGRSIESTFLRSTLATEVSARGRIGGAVVFDRPEAGGAPATLVVPVSIGDTHADVTLSLTGGGPIQPRPAPVLLPRPPAN